MLTDADALSALSGMNGVAGRSAGEKFSAFDGHVEGRHTRDELSALWHGSGLLVITVRGDQVAGLTRFESHTLRAFSLPRLLPGDDPQSSTTGVTN